MRRVKFPVLDRLVLVPLEVIPLLKKYPLYALVVLLIFGIQPEGILFREAFSGGLPFLTAGLLSIFAGAVLTPLLLPFIPFRSFAVKGLLTGLAVFIPLLHFTGMFSNLHVLLMAAVVLFFPALGSYIALLFTGSTTFTGISGVEKEIKVFSPFYIGALAVSLLLVAAYKIHEWGLV